MNSSGLVSESSQSSRSLNTQSIPTSNLPKKRSRNDDDCEKQEGQPTRDYDSGNSTPVSYAKLVKFLQSETDCCANRILKE